MEICFIILHFLGYAWAAGRLCRGCLESTKKKEILFVLLLWGGWSAASVARAILSALPAAQTALSLLPLIQMLLLAVLVFGLFRGVWEKKVLIVAALYAVIVLAGSFCSSAISCLILFWLHTVEKMPEPFLGEEMIWAVEYFAAAVVVLLLYSASKRFAVLFNGKERRWYITLAVPLFALTLVMLLVNRGVEHGVLVRAAEGMGLYYDQIFSHLYVMILCALSIFGAVSLASGMNRIHLEQQKSGQYQAQTAAYKMLDEQYEQAERLRHDMKNHLIVLGGLLEEQEFQKMRAYLEKMKESGGLENDRELTGNRAVDALLNNKRKKAEAEGISWECDVRMPKVCGIDEFDLCVLFGNILDNAIEACERLEEGRGRFIEVRAEMVKSCFLLEVKNSADGAKMQEMNENRRERGRTGGSGIYGNRVCGKERGIGLLNVSDMVKRYQGVMNREEGEGVYTISVLLPFGRRDGGGNGNKK